MKMTTRKKRKKNEKKRNKGRRLGLLLYLTK